MLWFPMLEWEAGVGGGKRVRRVLGEIIQLIIFAPPWTSCVIMMGNVLAHSNTMYVIGVSDATLCSSVVPDNPIACL